MNLKRARIVNDKSYKSGPIVYWMNRDHRVNDNWSLVYALEKAKENNTEVLVIFCLRTNFPYKTERLVNFILGGLEEVEKNLRDLNIPFYFLQGDPAGEIPKFIKEKKVGMLITDFNPLKPFISWKENIASKIEIPFFEVDSRNIVPCWILSNKQEFGAYTIRPKFYHSKDEFLDDFPKISKQNSKLPKSVNLAAIKKEIKIDDSVKTANWIKPGEKAAKKLMLDFFEKINDYDEFRNDPTKNAQSHLSTHLHFGHISSQRVVLELIRRKNNKKDEDSFLEELTVRRELSDNYCYYNKNYDNPNGFPDWAKKTLSDHAHDTRENIYSKKELENCLTHDDLWNACMKQAKVQGIMHGYLRMYWAKKIFEWSPNADTAQKTAIYFMDKYFLDGREANGFTGIAWSMGGVHDRAWFEREVFGKIRYMNYNGAKRKFDVEKYIQMVNELST